MELEIWISYNYIRVLYKSPTECNKCGILWFLLTAVYSLTWKTEKSMKEPSACLWAASKSPGQTDFLGQLRTSSLAAPTLGLRSHLCSDNHSTTTSCTAKRDRDQSDSKSKMVTWDNVIKWSWIRHSNHNMYAPDIRASADTRQIPAWMKCRRNSSLLTMGVTDTPLLELMFG